MSEPREGQTPVTAPEPAEHPALPEAETGRPRPRPTPGPATSPTSRARRAAAAAVDQPTRPAPSPAARPAAKVGSVAKGEAEVARPTPRPPSVGPAAAADPDAAAGAGRPSTAPQGDAALAAAPRTGAPRWLAALLVVLVVALAAASGWLLVTRGATQGSTTEREQALAAAKSDVPVILSYSYQSFDQSLAAGRARLTGRASSDYVQAMTRTIRPAAVKAHAVVQAQTDGAGVESVAASGKQVTVIVFGEQKVTNTSLSAPRTDLFRVRATLDLVGGRWLVSKFDQI